MAAVKPLIKDETRFLAQPDDFVTFPRDPEHGALEEMIERLARWSNIGSKVYAQPQLKKSFPNSF
jgi:hypothetical protein